jgi:hypothetical protein
MAQTSIAVLIPQTNYVGTNPLSIVGEKQQAAAFYLANSNLQTITWNVGNNINGNSPTYFVGTVKIQASLVTNPGVFDWFDVYTLPITATATGQSGFYNLMGNYVWLRAVVTQWTAGSILSIAASY